MGPVSFSIVVIFLGALVTSYSGTAATAVTVDSSQASRCMTFQETMDMCLAPIGGSFNLLPGSGHQLLSDLETTKTLCQEGKLQDAMTCLEEVFNDCAVASSTHHRHQNNTNLMLDVGKWRNGMERLCDNIDYLRQHEDCTRVIAVESSHCIQRESQAFIENSASVMAKALRRGRKGQKQLRELGCRFAEEVIFCFKTPLEAEESCPCRYRELMVDVVIDSLPSFCRIEADYYYYVERVNCLGDPDDFAGSSSDTDNPFDSKLRPVHGGDNNLQGSHHPKTANNTVIQIQHQAKPGKEGNEKYPGYNVPGVGQSQEQTGKGGSAICQPMALVLLLSLLLGIGLKYPFL